MRSSWYVALLAALFLMGCPEQNRAECAVDTNCNLSGGGVCTVAPTGNQWCAYLDETCPSGSRFSDQAGDGLAGACVEGSRYTLTVQVGGNGSGQVASSLPGLVCSAGTCTAKFREGALVDLSATATTGQFLGWADACRGPGECRIMMDRDRVVSALFGTPGESLWVQHLGSPIGDGAHAIAVDTDDNLIAVGVFGETILAGTGMELTSAGRKDIFVVKLGASQGNIIWARRFGGARDDIPAAVVVDDSNNIYITGVYEDIVDFGSGPLQAFSGSGFVLKVRPDGQFEWVRRLDGTGLDTADAVAVRGNTLVAATGYSGRITLDSPTGPITFNSVGGSDILVLKMSALTGETVWAKTMGGTGADHPAGVAIDSNSNVVVLGEFSGTTDFGGGPLSTGDNFLFHTFLLKLSDTGAHLQSKQFGGAGDTFGTALAVDSANNIVMTGYFNGSVNFECETLSAVQSNVADVFLAKFTQAGACLWAKRFGESATFDRRANDLTVNSSNEVALTGFFCGTISFGNSRLTAASACPAFDMFAARFGADGTHLNSLRAGGSGSESGAGIAQSSDGRFFVSGGFSGFSEFGGRVLTAVGLSDAFIVGFAPF